MELRSYEILLLDAVSKSIRGEEVAWEQVSEADWQSLVSLAYAHKLLPIVYQAVSCCPAAKRWEGLAQLRRQVLFQVMKQTAMHQETLGVLEELSRRELRPLVVKGMICRSVYPAGELRISGDEDLYVSEEVFQDCCRVMRESGLTASDENLESWRKTGTSLHIELHTKLFSQDWDGGDVLESFFGADAGCQDYEVEPGKTASSFDPHTHLLYLTLHAFKHFLYSGFGLRQICDIGLWAVKYNEQIDWQKLYRQCESVRAERFAGAVFQIAKEELKIAVAPGQPWTALGVDWMPLLRDVLDAGIYGSASESRLHSATVLQEQLTGRDSGLLRTAFPGKNAMIRKYPVLEEKPYLLPVMWLDRLSKYGLDVVKGKKDPALAVRIAQQRRELLEYYHII